MIEFYIFAHFKLRKQQLFTNSPPQSFVHQFEKISFLSAFEIKITVISSGNIYPANLKVIKIQKTILESSSLVVSSQKIKKPNKNDVKIVPWPRKFRSQSIEYMEIKPLLVNFNKTISRLNNFRILWTARNSRDQKQWEICCVTAQCVSFNHTCLIMISITKNMQHLF